METNLLQGLLVVFVFVLACMGWAGYWTEFNRRIKLEKQIKQFYGEV